MRKVKYKAAIYIEFTGSVSDFILKDYSLVDLGKIQDDDIRKHLTVNLKDETISKIDIISKLEEV